MLALQLEPLYAAEAKRKHDANGGDKKSDEYRESASQNSDAPKVRTDEQLAKLAGTSRDTIRKVSRASGVGASVFPPLGGKAFVRRVLGDERSRHLSAIGGGGTPRCPRPTARRVRKRRHLHTG